MYPNLNAELSRNEKNQIHICETLDLESSTVSNKMTGKSDWKLCECKKIISDLLPGNSIDYLFMKSNELN